MVPQRILFLTLVHPDFLPPVYAIANVLKDEGYQITILTFESLFPDSEFNVGDGIDVISLGRYHQQKLWKRLKSRLVFEKRANELAQDINAIISFCPFSYLIGIRLKKQFPHIYVALELANYTNDLFFKSPLTYLNNRAAIKKLHKADLVTTPSVLRSAWLAGRAGLEKLPLTVYNTSYYQESEDDDKYSRIFHDLVPPHFLEKIKVVYTGAVNNAYCVVELVSAFSEIEDDSVLIISGVKDNAYGSKIKEIVDKSSRKKDILLLPVVTRSELIALQRNCDIGICLSSEEDTLNYKMIAPNKIGEYIYSGMYLLGNDRDYLRQFEQAGIATVTTDASIDEVKKGLLKAVYAVSVDGMRDRVRAFAKSNFCMQIQCRSIVDYIGKIDRTPGKELKKLNEVKGVLVD